MTMELEVLCRHAPNRPAPRKEARELQPDVAGPRAIPILWQLAILILANAQAANSCVVFHPLLEDGFHFCLDFGPWAARMKASAARLRRELLRSRRNEKALSQLAHQPFSNARGIAFVGSIPCFAGDQPPRAVSEDELAQVAFLLHPFQIHA